MSLFSNMSASPFAKMVLAFTGLTLAQLLTTLVSERSQENNTLPPSTGFAVELLKLLISLTLIVTDTARSHVKYNTWPPTASADEKSEPPVAYNVSALQATVSKFRTQISWKLTAHSTALALLYYTTQRWLQSMYTSIDTGTVSLFTNLNTLVVVVLVWLLCNRQINHPASTALLLQIAGLGVLQYDPCVHSINTSQRQHAMLTCVTVLTALCSVWNERCIKQFNADLLVQNIVLYLFGVLTHLLGSYVSAVSLSPNLFVGVSPWTVTNIICQSCVGLAISAVYKYGDAILQTWASACATATLLVVHTLVSFTVANAQMYAGATVVCVACYIYMRAVADPPLPCVSAPIARVVAHPPASALGPRRRPYLMVIKAFLLILLGFLGYLVAERTVGMSPQSIVRPSILEVNTSTRHHDKPGATIPSIRNTPQIALSERSSRFFDIREVDPLRLNRAIRLRGTFNGSGSGLTVTINAVACHIYYFSRNEVVCNAPELLEKLPLNETVQLIFKTQFEQLSAVQNVNVRRLMTHWERHRIMLLICFGQPRYERLSFLSMFEDLFPKVVYAGTVAGENILLCPELPWHNHVCIARAIEKYPNYAGYLYQTFDVAVVLYNLLHFNTSELWRAKDYISNHPPFGSPVHENAAAGWMWSVHPILANTKQAFALINSEIEGNGPNAGRYRRYMKNLVTNAGSADMRLGSFSDLYYIPSRLVDDWLFLTNTNSVFAKCSVIHEIVSPTISWMITDKVNTTYEGFEGEYLTGTPIADFLRNPQRHYFHQVNMADRNHRDFVKSIKERSLIYV